MPFLHKGLERFGAYPAAFMLNLPFPMCGGQIDESHGGSCAVSKITNLERFGAYPAAFMLNLPFPFPFCGVMAMSARITLFWTLFK